jgi:hypothetical protein
VSESEAMELFKENPFKQRFISEALARGGPHVQLTACVHPVGCQGKPCLLTTPPVLPTSQLTPQLASQLTS